MSESLLVEQALLAEYPFVPPFFAPALRDRVSFEILWTETKRINGLRHLPHHLLEKIFIHLARLCPHPYGLLTHPYVLFPKNISLAEAVERLERPQLRRHTEYGESIQFLESIPADIFLTSISKQRRSEGAFLECVEYLFCNPHHAQDAERLFQTKLGPHVFFEIIHVTAYIRQCFVWVETHTDIAYEQDQTLLSLQSQYPALQVLQPLLSDYWRRIGALIKQRQHREEGLLGGMKLRVSEELFRTIFDSSPTGILILNKDRKVMKANKALCDMLGYTLQEMMQFTVEEFTHDEDRVKTVTFWNRLAMGELPVVAMEKRYVKKDGSIVWAKLRSSIVYTDQHDVAYSVGIIEDITSTRHAAEALRASEKHLREAEQLANIGHWEWDIHEQRVTWSDQLYRIYGEEKNMFTPSVESHAKLVHEDDRALVGAALKECQEKRKNLELDYRIVRRNGELRWAHARCIPGYDDTGHVTRLFGTVQDITETKLLNEHVMRLAFLVRHARVPITSFDLNHRYTSINMVAEQMVGFTEQQLLGRSIYEYIPVAYQQEFRYALEEVRQGKTLRQFRTRRRAKDGHEFMITMVISPIFDGEDRLIGYSTMMDI